MPAPKFEVIDDDNEPAESPVPEPVLQNILAGLKALPQKTAHVLSNCFALLTVTTVFVLALMIIPYTPSVYQLVGLGGYCCFIIAINIIARKK
jgi:hypothetical protein